MNAEDDVLLVHVDFLPILEQVWDRLETVKKIVVIADGQALPQTALL